MKSIFTFSFVAILLTLSIFSCAYRRIEFSGNIFARLEKNTLPQPISGAKILLTDLTSSSTHTDYSNSDGSYNFEIVESDTEVLEHSVQIEITKIGYRKIVVPRTGSINFINEESFYLEKE